MESPNYLDLFYVATTTTFSRISWITKIVHN